jgi:D-amino-acid dehydrogenase
MTPDSVPIIDRNPRLENVWLAAGHNMLGLSMSPGTGKLVAELMSNQEPHVDPFPYRMNRI